MVLPLKAQRLWHVAIWSALTLGAVLAVAGHGPPEDARLLLEEGRSAFRAERVQEAQARLEKAVRLAPADVEVRYWLGRTLEAQGRYGGAVQEFRRVLRARPQDTEVRLRLARAYRRLGEAKETYKVLHGGGGDDSRGVEYLLALGEAAEAVRRPDEALQAYTEGLPADRRNGQLQARLGALLLARASTPGERERARHHLLQAVTLAPSLPEPYLYLGRLLVEEGKEEEALSWLDRASDLAGKNLGILEQIANLLESVGRGQEARRVRWRYNQARRQAEKLGELERAVQEKPFDPANHNELGVAYHRQGERELATEEFKHAVALDSTYADAWGNLAALHAAERNHRLAVQEYERALRYNPRKAVFLHGLASVYDQMGRGELGRKTREMARQLMESEAAETPREPGDR